MPYFISCCVSKSSTSKSPTLAFNRTVKLYTTKIQSKQDLATNSQITEYLNTDNEERKCYIKDNSITAQETIISENYQGGGASKELIFDYFDIKTFNFERVLYAGVFYKVVGRGQITSFTANNVKYVADDNKYFVSVTVAQESFM